MFITYRRSESDSAGTHLAIELYVSSVEEDTSDNAPSGVQTVPLIFLSKRI
jgi:hypothetical protein